MNAELPPDAPLPVGYRQAVVTGITVPLTFSLIYFRFVVFELDDGPWNAWWVASAGLAAASIFTQGYSLWRSLQLSDDRRAAYAVTIRCFGVGLLLLVVSLVLSTVASLLD